MKIKKLLIIGAGGHGKSVAEAAKLSGNYEVVGFIDDAYSVVDKEKNSSVLGATADLKNYVSLCDEVIVAIGNNFLRESLFNKIKEIGLTPATVIHPLAIVSPSALIGRGCAIMAGAIIGTEAELGHGAIVNCGAIVDHHANVYDFAHLGVNVCMAGGSVLGRAAWIQAGCSLGYGVVVPDGAVLAPGVSLSTPPKQ